MNSRLEHADPTAAGRPIGDHKKLIETIERAHGLILNKADPSLLGDALDRLARLADREIPQEEAHLRSTRTPDWRAHRRQHRAFLHDLNVYRNCFAADAYAVDQADLYDFLSEWLVHVLCEYEEDDAPPAASPHVAHPPG